MAISGISVTKSRDEVVDFLTPHYISSSVVVFKSEQVKWHYFLKPFSFTVWLIAFIAPAIVAGILFLIFLTRQNIFQSHTGCDVITLRKLSRYTPILSSYMRKTYGCIFTQGYRLLDNSGPTRFVVAFYWLAIIMLSAVYTGNLTASLAVIDIKEPFKTLDELAVNDDYILQVLDGTAQMALFQHAKSGVFKRLWDKIQRQPGSIVYNETAAFERVAHSSQYAYTDDKLAFVNFMVTCPWCGVTQMKEEFSQGGIAIVVRERVPYREAMNKAVQRMVDMGLVHYYRSLYLRYWNSPNANLGPQKDGQPVTLNDLYLVFGCVFCGGLTLASAVLVVEYTRTVAIRKRGTKT